MLLRRDENDVLAIGQPSHAWLSGQLARSWGNDQFGLVDPWEEVCLAAEQHDVGWSEVDLNPIFDPEAGLPRSFMNMPLDVHLELWTSGPRALLTQSLYAALLVSMHGWRLYERRDLDRAAPEEATAIKDFLAEQRSFQQELIDKLRADPAQVQRNSRLIWTWDYISLALCLDWDPATAKAAPTLHGSVDLELQGRPDGTFAIDPWPFQSGRVCLRCEGRRLSARFADEADMRRGLSEAPIETLELVLARSACSPASPDHGA